MTGVCSANLSPSHSVVTLGFNEANLSENASSIIGPLKVDYRRDERWIMLRLGLIFDAVVYGCV